MSDTPMQPLEPKLKSINPTPHLNRSRVKRTALDLAAQSHFSYAKGKCPKFTRVGASFLARVEQAVYLAIIREVKLHPVRGKTLL